MTLTRIFLCVCGHLNTAHDHRVGQGPFRCARCECTHFEWDGK